MCKECGCGSPGEHPPQITTPGQPTHAHPHVHGHEHPHHHHHHHDYHSPGHSHSHAHEHELLHTQFQPHEQASDRGTSDAARRKVQISRPILDRNDRLAERNRGYFRARGLLVLNVVSSPGSGKTTFLRETLLRLKGHLRAGVIVGDLATENDGLRLRESGAPVVQITTGTVCHLEAEMIGRAMGQLPADQLDLLIIENVGNLVCPAAYDLGEDLRLVLLSVTEGEDKPLKYPPIFQSAHAVVVSKMDLQGPCEFNRQAALGNLAQVAPTARVFEVSARSGAGMEAWIDYLRQQVALTKTRSPLD